MKKIIFALLVLIFQFSGSSQTIIPAGAVSGVWTAAGSPYLITGNIQCGTLVIQPGVDVRFQNMSGLTVNGSVKAIGTALLPITFESDDTTGWSNFSVSNGGTAGINIPGNSTDTSIFDHCIIKDAKQLYTNSSAVCLMVMYSNFILSNSEIYHNYVTTCSAIIGVSYCSPQILNNSIHDNISSLCGGIDIWDSHGIISGNDFYNNTGSEGGAIFCCSDADPIGPTIVNNNIHNNRSTLDGGGVYLANGPVTMMNNKINFNHSARAGAGIYVLYARAKIFSNWICNNTDSIYPNCGITDGGGGIVINSQSYADTVEICNNIIANNNSVFSGGGIRFAGGSGGTAFVENNHIINNTSNGAYSGGVAISLYWHVNIRNNIIWGNMANMTGDTVQISTTAYDILVLEYNCIETCYQGIFVPSSTTVVNGNQASNIFVSPQNPGLVAPTSGAGISFDATLADWHLLPTSSCIDAGTLNSHAASFAFDVYNDPRILGTIIDIGAVEYPVGAGISEYNKNAISVFPNPATDKIFIKDGNPLTEIRVTDVLGNVVLNLNYGNGIDISALSEGIYLLSFVNEKGNNQTQPFVKQ